MTENLYDCIDRTVVTDEFLKDISNCTGGWTNTPKLGVETAQEAYVCARDALNQKRLKRGLPLLTDSDIMERIRLNRGSYDASIQIISERYHCTKLQGLIKNTK